MENTVDMALRSHLIDLESDKILVYSQSRDGLAEISATLTKCGADFKPESDYKKAVDLVAGGEFSAVMSDVTDMEDHGVNLLEIARNQPGINIASFGFIRTEYPNIIADVYDMGADQCFFHSRFSFSELTLMMAYFHSNLKDSKWMESIVKGRQSVLAFLNRHSDSLQPILLDGPCGSGKIALAQLFHTLGGRKNRRFIVAECKSRFNIRMPKKVLVDQKALRNRIRESIEIVLGHAWKGTVLFHDISCLTIIQQEALLDVLKKGMCMRAKNDGRQAYQGRIVFTTHDNLTKLTREGKFSKELFDLLSDTTVNIPSLSNFKSDIPRMAQTIVTALCLKSSGSIMTFTEKAKVALSEHPWKENMMELYRVVSESLSIAQGNKIRMEELPLDFDPNNLESNEKRAIIRLMKENNNNKSEVARILEISRTTLYKRFDKYGLNYD